MKMNEPNNFDTQAIVSSSVDGSLLITSVLIALFSAWFFMNIWSVNLVANGIWAVKLFPPSFSENLVLFFAFALQSIPAILGLITPLFFTSILRMLLWLAALVLCIGIIGFEMYHSVYAQYKNSTGTALYKKEKTDIEVLEGRISAVNQQIAETYKQKTAAFELLANNAAKGLDESGIAKCEAICKSYRKNFATATARYSHLSLNEKTPPFVITENDLLAQFTRIKNRTPKLSAAIKDLTAFYQELDKSAPPAGLMDEVKNIEKIINEKEKRYQNMSNLSAETLALENTNEAFSAVMNGSLPVAEARLPLVYGILPALCIFALSLFIRICISHVNYGLGHVAASIAKETIASRMLSNLAKLRHKNFINNIKAQYNRWDNSK